jgi:hypothetical protein
MGWVRFALEKHVDMEVIMKQIVKIDEVLVDQIINEMISILDSDYCSVNRKSPWLPA